jgi:hypothetical protein
MMAKEDDHAQLVVALHRIDEMEKKIAENKAEFTKLHENNVSEIVELKKKLGYYDRMALKWGSLCIGFVSFGALASMGLDRIKEKLLQLIAAW